MKRSQGSRNFTNSPVAYQAKLQGRTTPHRISERGFAAAAVAQSGQPGTLQQKALLFTESRRTQEYLYRLLEQTEFAGKVVLFNGSNTDEKSQTIYRAWMDRYKVHGSHHRLAHG